MEFHLVDSFGIDQGLFDLDKNNSPIQGDSLILTIDEELQSFCEKKKEIREKFEKLIPENAKEHN